MCIFQSVHVQAGSGILNSVVNMKESLNSSTQTRSVQLLHVLISMNVYHEFLKQISMLCISSHKWIRIEKKIYHL